MNRIIELKKAIEENESILSYNNIGLLNYNLKINPCISDYALKNLELTFSVSLPEEYRDYLLYIGNGGNQPGDGMLMVEQSLSLMFGLDYDGGNLEYKDLTKYYYAINLCGCENLLECYYEMFGKGLEKKALNPEVASFILDDYFSEEGIFKYQHLLSENEDAFIKCESAMKTHMLVFSFDDITRTQYAIAMDGDHKHQVVYYSYEPTAKCMSGRNIVFTNMSFLEWMHHLYERSCNPNCIEI